jgi:dihydroorotate dehydrogenase (fumarate)
MAAIDLSTRYLGLHLDNPFVVGASPLANHLDTVRRLEDAGCAAIVLHSLFEEQITQERTGRIRYMDPFDPTFSTALSYFPKPDQYAAGPDGYLEHLRQVKAAVKIPVIASLNGTTPGAWLKFAQLMQDAGADALELNMYEVVTDPAESALAVERGFRQVILDLKHDLRIPVAVKLSPFFTALSNVATEFDHAGADGLVLFNRFLQPDIDVRHLTVWPRLELSDSTELLLRLRWLAILHGRLRGSLAVTGGVAAPADAIKAILAGAHVVQMVSAILRHGPSYFIAMREELRRWMESLEFARMDDVRGRLSMASTEDPAAFERAQYVRTLSGWSTWMAYQAYQRAHAGEDAERRPS